jgi:DNA adenine methylase
MSRKNNSKVENEVKEEVKDDILPPLPPLVKWSGGKKDEIPKFIQYIPNDIDTYLEPFIGGGSVFFHTRPEKSVINDIHKELIDFYTAIKNGHRMDIYNFMANHNNDEKTYYEVRDEFKIDNELNNAKRFFYLRKTCYRGMLRYNKSGKFNIPFGRYKTYNYEILRNEEYENVLSNCTITNTSFENIFKMYNDERNFMFLDPPYDSVFTDYGYCVFGKDEHERLAKCFKETKIRCLMVIGKTDYIVNLYRDYIVDEYDKKYRFKLHSGRIGNDINTIHLVIKNY